MNRTPPDAVKNKLRQEVGFGCPVPDCGCPYLEWHHFDPPWREENHHNPDGMIALCRRHHIEADHGAYTKVQLHDFKKSGKRNWQKVKGKFNWMRRKLLAVVGGNFYYECPVIFQYKEEPIIWFKRDENGYCLLNLKMLSNSGDARAYMINNEWFSIGNEIDIECPPSGKKIIIKYENSDLISIKFFELQDIEDLKKKYPHAKPNGWDISFPITAVEVINKIADSEVNFNASKTFVGTSVITGCFFSNCGVGFCLS